MHNVLSIVLVRIPCSYIAARLFADTLFPMGLAAPLGSLLSVAVCLSAFAVLRKKGAGLRARHKPDENPSALSRN